MPTWSTLWTQRKRWQRGALDNLAEYGVTTATARYWGQQLGIAYGVVALFSAYFFLIVASLAMEYVHLYIFWLVVTTIFIIDRVGTVWAGGWSARLVAAPLVIEVAYSFFLQLNFISSLIDLVRRKKQKWGHLPSPAGVDRS
jgi:cellulose synthase/poly-beta-1,6-N-acetylglucosamine synthase-like glycosyltransferase